MTVEDMFTALKVYDNAFQVYEKDGYWCMDNHDLNVMVSIYSSGTRKSIGSCQGCGVAVMNEILNWYNNYKKLNEKCR